MLYPSIQELLTATSKDGKERLNKYSITMATAKCARMVTNEYLEQRYIAEKKISNKETDKDFLSLVNKEYRDEKSVKNALKEMKQGKFEIYLPDEEGYENSVVDVQDYVEPKEEYKPFKPMFEAKQETENEAYDDFDSKELMDADEVYTEETGYSIADSEEEL